MEEKLFLFNPFNIKSINEKELASMYQEVFKKIIDEPNSMYQYAQNVEVYSNLNYIIGEVIARLTKEEIQYRQVKRKAKCENICIFLITMFFLTMIIASILVLYLMWTYKW